MNLVGKGSFKRSGQLIHARSVYEMSRHHMICKAFVMQVNPDQHKEYRKRHSPIWSEDVAITENDRLSNCTFENLTIEAVDSQFDKSMIQGVILKNVTVNNASLE